MRAVKLGARPAESTVTVSFPSPMDGRRDEVAARGVAGIVDQDAVFARVDHDRGVDPGIVGRGKRQQRAGAVAEGEQPRRSRRSRRPRPSWASSRVSDGLITVTWAPASRSGADLALGDGAAADDDDAPVSAKR